MSTLLLSVQNINKRFGGLQALSEVGLQIAPGQIYGLIGPNGAGKTTTLRMLMGLIFPTEGSIYMDGKAVYPGSPALANLGSFVEGPGFLPHLSGRENLDLYWKSIGRSGEKYLDEVISITKLGTALDKKVRSYSQGMRQRLAIAQAMLGMPDLLVLDEPTNGLDPAGIQEVRALLRQLANEGCTIFVSSHLLSELEMICDHLVMLREGKVIFTGKTSELLAAQQPVVVAKPEHMNDLNKLADIAKSLGHQATVLDDAVHVKGEKNFAAELNKAAFAAGITLASLAPIQASLEETFFEMTGEQ